VGVFISLLIRLVYYLKIDIAGLIISTIGKDFIFDNIGNIAISKISSRYFLIA
jgi:hypothetical protein